MDPLPSLGQVDSFLLQEDRERQVKKTSNFLTEGASFQTTTQTEAAHRAASSNHFQSKTPLLFEARRQKEGLIPFVCDHWLKQGHTIALIGLSWYMDTHPNANAFKGFNKTRQGQESSLILNKCESVDEQEELCCGRAIRSVADRSSY